MKELTYIDYIIVGQGLAGSAVAMQLLKRGRRILVIDQPDQNHSSRLAAGLFNPITGQNSVKTWLADQLFPYLNNYYQEVERLTNKKFFFPMDLYRPFASVHEQNEWMGKSSDEMYGSYIKQISTRSIFPGIKDPFGGLVLNHCGYINAVVYLQAVREYVNAHGQYRLATFDENNITLHSDSVTFEGFRASSIIFCQGVRGMTGKRFKDLPIKPLKGEVLDIKINFEKHVILNRGVYMVPGGVPGVHRVGATYRFNDTTACATEVGKQELEQKLKDLVDIPYEVVGQEWGIRPTTTDRRPLLGCYPESERLVIFNGLGTKGVSLAPYFSEVLIRWLENGGPLNKEVSVTRYK